jgi:hypothetical protein
VRDVDDLRRAQDVRYTGSVRETWGSGEKSAVFALPDAGEWRKRY